MDTKAEVALEDMSFNIVYRPESTTGNPPAQEQLARDMEGWNCLLSAILDKNSTMELPDKDHIVLMVQQALAGAFEEFKKTLVCQCRFKEGER